MGASNRQAGRWRTLRKRKAGSATRSLRWEPLEERVVLSGMTPWDAGPFEIGQLIYLDFDGAENVTYDGPVRIENIDVPAFSAADLNLPGQEGEIIAAAIAQLNAEFATANVVFTLTEPKSFTDYSTVYIGGYDTQFAEYGSFYGLAEQTDLGNAERDDNAFVFSSELSSGSYALPVEYYAIDLATVISHEVRHLIGVATHDGEDGFMSVAYAQGTSNPVHQFIGQQGADLFARQFGTTSLTDQLQWFIQGIHDEDEQALNPFGQDFVANHPSTRHFWGHDVSFNRDPVDGLSGFDSAPNRAVKYITGGFGFDGFQGGLDAWGDGPKRPGQVNATPGEGAAQLYSADPETAFYYLGHAVHLLQDMSVPAHVHNDPHLELGAPLDPDPYHDWVDGREFSTSILAGNRQSYFNNVDPDRWTNYGLTSDPPIRTASQITAATTLINAVDVAALFRLFSSTAGLADDFDSKDVNGQVDAGVRRTRHQASLVDLLNYNDWDEADLDQMATILVPRAILDTAESVRYYYSVVDSQPAEIKFIAHPTTDENNPHTVSNPVIRLKVAATDSDTGDSGISKDRFTLRYREKAPNGNWTEWMEPGSAWSELQASHFTADMANSGNFVANPGGDLAGQRGALAQPVFQGQDGYTYGFEVTVEDGAGNTQTQETYIEVDASGINVVEVIDRSGSMGDEGKLAAAQQAASTFVDLMDGNDRIGIASYASSASVDFPLTQIAQGTTVQQQAKAAINGLSAAGDTSIGAGILAADGQLDTVANEPIRALIVLTDGVENTSPYALDVIDSNVAQDVRIYTIGFGSDADTALLQNIANQRPGTYHFAATPSELQQIYVELSGAVGGEQAVFQSSGTVFPGQQIEDGFRVDASSEQLTLGLTWPGSDLDLKLIAPDGSIIDHATAGSNPLVEFIEGPTSEFVKVDAPMLGAWKVRVVAVDVAANGEAYNLFARVDSQLKGTLNAPQFSLQRTVDLQFTLDDGAPVTGAAVLARVFRPVVREFASTDVPVAISDNTTVTSQLVVAEALEIQDVDLSLDIDHTYDGDLDVFLISPNGTRIELFTDVGSSGDGFQATVLDDEASTDVASASAPFTGRFRPEGTLSALDGQNTLGTWRLEITDDAGGDIGQLNSWSLRFTSQSSASHTVALFDDGAHHDDAAGDGVYGNSVPLGDAGGSYHVQLEADGSANAGYSFHREQSIDIGLIEHSAFVIDSEGDLFSVDPSSGELVNWGRTSVIMADIAAAPSGEIFGASISGQLYRIELDYAARSVNTTLVGSLGVGANSLEFRDDGVLFAAAANRLYHVNTVTGAATLVSSAPSQFVSAGDIEFDPAGTLYMTTISGELLRLEPTLTTWTVLGTTGRSDMNGLVYSNGLLYGFSNSESVYRLDVSNGSSTFLTDLAHSQLDGVYGAANSRFFAQGIQLPGSILTWSSGDSSVTTLLSDTDRFIPAQAASITPLAPWVGFAAGDFNGDGFEDVVRRNDASGAIRVLVSNGTGEFVDELWGNVNPNSPWTNWLVGDFNGDGRDDLFRVNSAGGGVRVLKSTGSGFVDEAWGSVNPNSPFVGYAVGDFTGDGMDDVLRRNNVGGGIRVFQSTGNAFNDVLWGAYNPNSPWVDWLVGDFNGDGWDDLFRWNLVGGGVRVFTSNGSTFTDGLWSAVHPNSPWVDWMLGDFDGNGTDDVIRRNSVSGGLRVLRSTNGASFTDSLWGALNSSIAWQDFRVADFTHDGRDDLARIHPTTGALRVFEAGATDFSVDALWSVLDPNNLPNVFVTGAFAVEPAPLLAVGGARPANAALLAREDLALIAEAAIYVWQQTGLSDGQVELLRSVSFEIADLPGAYLGLAASRRILIDIDAAGYGWFIDPTPLDDSEFTPATTDPLSLSAAQHMDLLTAVMHELGHVLGWADLDPLAHGDNLMAATLAPGLRRTEFARAVDTAFEDPKAFDARLNRRGYGP